jgi:hypothetical protein
MDTPNHFTARGAEKLAKRIERYWKERGYAGIKAHIVEHIVDLELLERGERRTIYFVRSNIGPLGFPPEKEASLD